MTAVCSDRRSAQAKHDPGLRLIVHRCAMHAWMHAGERRDQSKNRFFNQRLAGYPDEFQTWWKARSVREKTRFINSAVKREGGLPSCSM